MCRAWRCDVRCSHMIMGRLRRVSVCVTGLFLCAVLNAFAAPREGDDPPIHVGVTLDGEPVLLAPHSGKAIVVSFWATWCPYCLKELPILNSIQKAAGKEHMQVIAPNLATYYARSRAG
jgi:thiol-disulfide isomerase/thioredoxin